jgi:hypothetical protein
MKVRSRKTHLGKNHLFRLAVVAGAALVAAVPTAQAASPDDRALYRGAATGTVRGDSPAPFWPHETGALAGTSETFVDMRADGSYYDPSLGRRVARAVESKGTGPAVAVSPSRFDWGDALIGVTFGLAFALLAGGAVLIAVRHRRSVLRTA